ncbi:DUF1254 domain-containing protein [Paractinoplanes toevensis]|uniref:DUF1254 domain-containing protein n=1 Tax=Paractinoplanes toevensis TaxID=571911 RepID=UPI001BB30DE1|nr:DUF1254 domain-containing protein [Actinoplanes toevensis]
MPPAITTPATQKSEIGTLEFTDGYPTRETAAKLRDHLDYLHGVDTFLNTIHGVSTYALREGFLEAGIADGDVAVFSGLMDSASLFLTGNADTVYFWSFLDLSQGPLVVETPADTLGCIDDMWFGWISDFGLPGADRGQGGTYLLVGPGYDKPLPEGGCYVRHSRTNHITLIGRAFINANPGNDPAPTVAQIKDQLKIYPYAVGGIGSSIGAYLRGRGPLGAPGTPASPRFVEGTGRVMNTIPPNDFGHFEFLDRLVQLEPAEALDPELAGQFAAIGIVKGETFAPDERLRAILDEAVAVGNAAARTIGMGALPSDGFRYYDGDTAWWNMLFVGGFEFTNPPPNITADGVQLFPNRGARQLHSRTSMFYTATAITPAMCMRLTGVGSQYLLANVDPDGNPFDGARTYRVRLPKDIPAERFWSLTVYDNQTRSMLQTPQRYPRAGSQMYPTPAAEAEPDGSTVVYFAPTAPDGVAAGNWIQTDPAKGWFVVLRLYSPLQPFFDKTWRPGEIELVD